ncbi:hypothetical protein HAX54_045090 [Datura stramonium]|uniref:Uncharacterized protein n=1 Tax=Datura stramonium TaxID=4076 RepID=A0ABS8WJ26_DATST|nr:hypothetical protein [Datura stramonium]
MVQGECCCECLIMPDQVPRRTLHRTRRAARRALHHARRVACRACDRAFSMPLRAPGRATHTPSRRKSAAEHASSRQIKCRVAYCIVQEGLHVDTISRKKGCAKRMPSRVSVLLRAPGRTTVLRSAICLDL